MNVACVPQYSPLRYPGGKTWLIPHIRAWLGNFSKPPRLLLEPFAGGGIVSFNRCYGTVGAAMPHAELDRDVAAFWHAALRHGPELCNRILGFNPTRDTVNDLSAMHSRDLIEHGFRTLVLNRTRRGGILAPGASLSREGEKGKGVSSPLVSRNAHAPPFQNHGTRNSYRIL